MWNGDIVDYFLCLSKQKLSRPPSLLSSSPKYIVLIEHLDVSLVTWRPSSPRLFIPEYSAESALNFQKLTFPESTVQTHSKTSRYININNVSFTLSINKIIVIDLRGMIWFICILGAFLLWISVTITIMGLFLLQFYLFLAFRMTLNWIKSYWSEILVFTLWMS